MKGNAVAATFELNLLDQYWISGSRDPQAEPEDTTSHGKISLAIGGQDVSGCQDENTDYGINQSAVALLQTVFINHAPGEQPPDTSMASWFVYCSPIFYDGGNLLGASPVCIIDFRVRHTVDDEVELDRFHVTGGPEGSNPTRFHGRSVRLRNQEYARTVLRFAEEALAFLPPSKGSDHEARCYQALRAEHVALVELVKQYLGTGEVTGKMRARARGFDVDGCRKRKSRWLRAMLTGWLRGKRPPRGG